MHRSVWEVGGSRGRVGFLWGGFAPRACVVAAGGGCPTWRNDLRF